MTDSDPAIVAHRGFAGVNPENTVGAVRAAAPDATLVEVDVVACADGTPVVFHDARLDGETSETSRENGERPAGVRGDADDEDGSRGLTDGHGAVRNLPPETVTAAEVLGSGEQVPTFDRLLDATDAPLNVELKRPLAATADRGPLPPGDRDAARERWRPLVDRVLDALDDGRPVRLSSFYEGALAAIRARDETASLAPIYWDADTAVELATRYDADAVHLSLSAVDDAAVAAAHDAGYPVAVWTVRTWHEAAEAARAGADELIADYPGVDRWLGTKSG